MGEVPDAWTIAPVVLFADKNPVAANNTRQFPRSTSDPALAHHLSYSNTVFAQYALSGLTSSAP